MLFLCTPDTICRRWWHIFAFGTFGRKKQVYPETGCIYHHCLYCLVVSFVFVVFWSFWKSMQWTTCSAKGHDLEKPTVLLGDLPFMDTLKRVMSKEARLKYKQMRERRNLRRKVPKVYYVSKGGKVSGTKLLAMSATYPTRFANALVKLWVDAFQAFHVLHTPGPMAIWCGYCGCVFWSHKAMFLIFSGVSAGVACFLCRKWNQTE